MCTSPEWLLEMMNLDGEWETTLTRLYALFTIDFKKSSFRYSGILVWWNRYIREDDEHKYEEGFWHLITEDDFSTGTLNRVPDYQRAKRLPWCRPAIVNSNDPIIKIWEYQEGNGKIRTYLWLEHFDYVIILEKRNTEKYGDIMYLITAHHVGGDSTRHKLNNKYINRYQ